MEGHALRLITVLAALMLFTACAGGPGAGSEVSPDLYGQEQGLECHSATQGENSLSSEVLDYAEGAGYTSLSRAIDLWWDSEASVVPAGRESLTEHSTSSRVVYTDGHGHAQIVLELGQSGDMVRVETAHSCQRT